VKVKVSETDVCVNRSNNEGVSIGDRQTERESNQEQRCVKYSSGQPFGDAIERLVESMGELYVYIHAAACWDVNHRVSGYMGKGQSLRNQTVPINVTR